jgi:SdrD B-like domain
MKRQLHHSAFLITHNYFPMKKGFNAFGQLLNIGRAVKQRLLFSYANYFTILFFLGLLGDPSVLSAQTCSGTAAVVVSQTGVDFPTEALGAVNGTAAQLWDTGDQIVLDLNNVLNSGSTIVVTWKGNTSSTADPIINVETSSNGTTFTAVAGSPFTLARTAAFYTNNITASGATRYVRFTTTNVYNVDLDALTFTNQACSPLCGTNTAGIVWRDYDSDGVKDANETQGLAGVTVKAFDCNGNLAETATTDANGQYAFTSLTPSATNKYRIEYSNLPPQYKPSLNGTSNKSDVQFITAASCNLNFGVNIPSDYCQASPPLIINCYVPGSYNGANAAAQSRLRFCRRQRW